MFKKPTRYLKDSRIRTKRPELRQMASVTNFTIGRNYKDSRRLKKVC